MADNLPSKDLSRKCILRIKSCESGNQRISIPQ